MNDNEQNERNVDKVFITFTEYEKRIMIQEGLRWLKAWKNVQRYIRQQRKLKRMKE